MSLTFKDVTEILKLIDASDCDELILELEGARLVVRRNISSTAEATFTPTSGEEVPVTLPASEAKTALTTKQPTVSAEPGVTDVRSPMVGTFYRRPSPDEPAFVEEGAKVKQGEAICLIEVMKLFTTIEAPHGGTVVSIATEDGALVEFDQLLFQISAD